nr:glycosyltransferase family 29 protein [uncultured Celeribacter sp.]
MTPLQRLRFHWACRRNDDRYLERFGDPFAQLGAEVTQKRIALVGNARALTETEQGATIDAQDLVIRINRAPQPSVRSHGSRTDWLGLAVALSAEDLKALSPKRVLWMSHKRKRLSPAIATRPGFSLFPMSQFDDLSARLGSRPTTGALLIDWLVSTHAAEIHLFGFDFFSSLSLSGARTANQVPHDFNAEADMVQNLCATDPRVILHPPVADQR